MQLRISPAQSAEFFVYVTFFQRNADSAAEQCESTCWAPTLQLVRTCKAQPSAQGKTLQKARSACVVEKITSTKNSAVGQPIRELHTLVYLLLLTTIPTSRAVIGTQKSISSMHHREVYLYTFSCLGMSFDLRFAKVGRYGICRVTSSDYCHLLRRSVIPTSWLQTYLPPPPPTHTPPPTMLDPIYRTSLCMKV